jgi:hypothetical protein
MKRREAGSPMTSIVYPTTRQPMLSPPQRSSPWPPYDTEPYAGGVRRGSGSDAISPGAVSVGGSGVAGSHGGDLDARSASEAAVSAPTSLVEVHMPTGRLATPLLGSHRATGGTVAAVAEPPNHVARVVPATTAAAPPHVTIVNPALPLTHPPHQHRQPALPIQPVTDAASSPAQRGALFHPAAGTRRRMHCSAPAC